jgi:hypothetical protein
MMYVQLGQLFEHMPIRGSLGSFLGAFGWCQFEIYPFAYSFLMWGIAAGLAADLIAPSPPSQLGATRGWAWLPALATIAAQFPAVVMIMYEDFTAVAADNVVGVQGRYFLSAIAIVTILAIGRLKARLRKSSETTSWVFTVAAGVACLIGNLAALVWVGTNFWA